MSWNYAELSKAAKKAGGPEALVMTLIKFGRSQMIPKVIGTGIIGAGVGIGITKCVDCVRNYRKRLAVVNGRFCPQSVRNFCPIVAGFNAGTYKVPACVL